MRKLRLKFPTDEELQGYAEQLNKKSVEDLYADIGKGGLSPRKVTSLIEPNKEEKEVGFVGKVIDRIRGKKGIKVHGLDNMMFRFAGCCQPIPGEDIVGFITRGRGVTIHRGDCNVALDLQNQYPERKIDVSWDAGRGQSFIVRIEIIVEDRKHMLRDVMQAIADADTNIRAAEMRSNDTTATGEFVLEISSLSHLNRVLEKVRKIKGVIKVTRSHGKENPDLKDSIDS